MKHGTSLKAMTPALAALALAGCGSIIPAGQGGSSASGGSYSANHSYNDRSQNAASRQRARQQQVTYSRATPARLPSAAPQSIAPRASEASCISELNANGARFEALPDTYAAPGCNRLGTVQISALRGDRAQFGISNLGPLKCEVANAFSNWARFGVDRAARQILGSPLAKIETMGSYSCRNVAGTDRRSAHATAEAIDVSGFVLEDGRRITLTQDWDGGSAAEREFLRVVHRSACKRFGTVLGPEYNAAHKDHFHMEGTGSEFCR